MGEKQAVMFLVRDHGRVIEKKWLHALRCQGRPFLPQPTEPAISMYKVSLTGSHAGTVHEGTRGRSARWQARSMCVR